MPILLEKDLAEVPMFASQIKVHFEKRWTKMKLVAHNRSELTIHSNVPPLNFHWKVDSSFILSMTKISQFDSCGIKKPAIRLVILGEGYWWIHNLDEASYEWISWRPCGIFCHPHSWDDNYVEVTFIVKQEHNSTSETTVGRERKRTGSRRQARCCLVRWSVGRGYDHLKTTEYLGTP